MRQAATGESMPPDYRQATRPLTPSETTLLAQYAQRRIAGEPVARILGEKEFWGLSFQLSPATLEMRSTPCRANDFTRIWAPVPLYAVMPVLRKESGH